MWQGQYETTTDVPAETLFRVIADINNWNKWDDGLEFTKLEGIAQAGAPFTLKPKGGPNVKMTIDEIKPYRLVDTAHLFLAKMRTSHEICPIWQTNSHPFYCRGLGSARVFLAQNCR